MSDSVTEAGRQTVLKRALSEIRGLKAELAQARRWQREPVAIVGLGCRLPGGISGADSFWQALAGGVDCVSTVPPGRWDADAWFDPDPAAAGKSYTRQGGFLSGDVAAFDPGFFRLSPRETATMDPQQRLLLEVAWEALEHAGIAPAASPETGVFIGISANDYAQLTMFGDPAQIEPYTATGAALNAAAGRISYLFGFQGPAMAVDTACSSSLVAVHLACQSLRQGECRVALAGGVSLILLPNATVATCRARMMAPDGRCKTFDAAADGYGRGEGCGIVVLKRLEDALAGGDNVLAVIRGSAVNQDGASGALTVPNGAAQRRLIRAALANAGIRPAEIGYVEAHGTGTPLGDPIELEALQAVYGEGRDATLPCAIGSVKTNIGHLEAAAGVAGLIKLVLALGQEVIPPHLHLRSLNPQIELAPPFSIPVQATAWRRGEAPRHAGVSSFGFTGTNAHVIVSEAPVLPRAAAEVERGLHVLTVSARTAAGLAELRQDYAGHLAQTSAPLGDIGFTANAGRTHFEHRLAVVASSREQAAARLVQGTFEGVAGAPPRIAFLFTGQGAQYAGMGRGLYATQPVFRNALDQCAELLREHLPVPLLEVLYGAQGGLTGQTLYTQPLLFALEYSLAALWRGWGVEPAVVLGHSVGEYAAACVAGILTLEDGLRLIARRARLMQGLPPGGAMAALRASAAQLAPALAGYAGQLSLAAVNGVHDAVVSGEAQALEDFCEAQRRQGVAAQMLPVSHAFHSPLMQPIVEDFAGFAAGIPHHRAQLRLIRDLDGALADGTLDAGYWPVHLRQPVQFHAALQTLRAQDCTVALEIGPHPVLLALGQSDGDTGIRRWLPSLRRQRDDEQTMLESLAQLYAEGAAIDWAGYDKPFQRGKTPLPTYRFQRKKFWAASTAAPADAARASGAETAHPYLGRRLASPLAAVQFETDFSPRAVPMVGDHRIFGMPWVNLVTYLELAAAGFREARGAAPAAILGLNVPRALTLREDDSRRVQLTLEETPEQEQNFRIHAQQPDGGWTLHARGVLGSAVPPAASVLLAPLRGRCTEAIAPAAFYAAMERHGVSLGPSCRWLDAVWRGEGEALGRIRAARPGEVDPRLVLDLGALDACFQLLGTVLPADAPSDFVFAGLGRLDYAVLPERGELWAHAVLGEYDAEAGSLTGHLRIFDAQGQVLADIGEARLQRIQRGPAAAEDTAARPHIAAAQLIDLPADEGVAQLRAYLRAELACSLRLDESEIDMQGPLAPQIHSLIAVELNASIERNLHVSVPVAALLDGCSLDGLAQLLWEEVRLPELDEDLLAEMLDRLDEISDAEATARLQPGDGVGGLV